MSNDTSKVDNGRNRGPNMPVMDMTVKQALVAVIDVHIAGSERTITTLRRAQRIDRPERYQRQLQFETAKLAALRQLRHNIMSARETPRQPTES